MAGSFTLFEISWEVCNKVGGIHTVVSSKAESLVERMGDDYVAVGPWLLSDIEQEIPFDEEPAYADFAESCRAMGVPVRVGRWRIPGRPRTILVEFSKSYERKDDVLSGLWEDFGVDSITGDWDYVEPLLFGHAAGRVIQKWWEDYLAPHRRRAVVHAHEWMTGSSLLHLKKRVPAIGTVFTTHATMLGRALSSIGHSPEDGLGDQTPEELAETNGVQAKHSLEGICAREADTFTTVSEITAREAELLHQRAPDPVTPNGVDLDVIDAVAGATGRDEVRTLLQHTASRFLGEDVSDAAFLAISGRYEFRNKGMDVLLDSLARIDGREGRRIVLFVLVPAGNSGIRGEFLERKDLPLESIDGPMGISTHNLFDHESDPVLEHCARLGLDNAPDSRVKVVQIPIYLGPDDGFLGLPYEGVLRAMDLSCFPSYYEPWGYTPQESLALGVPTITTDYAGFGRWVQGQDLGSEEGVTVLPRVHVQYDDVCARLDEEIEAFLTGGRSARELGEVCRETASRTSWSGFLAHYEDAYAKALAAVQGRMVSGVPQMRRRRLPVPVQPAPEGVRPRLLTFDVAATLPPELEGLSRLARNYWWCWDPEGRTLFEDLSPLSWEVCAKNPVLFLQRVYPEDLEVKAADPKYVERLGRVLARYEAYMAEPRGEGRWQAPAGTAAEVLGAERPVAYFCAEYGIHESLRIYSGGLGVLAGDHLKSASDLNLPLVAVGLYYRMGYFSQRLGPNNEQVALDLENDPRALPVERVRGEDGKPLVIALNLPGRELNLRAWKVGVGRVPLYLLDTNLPSNRPEDRDITRNLYAGEPESRLLQEIVLGRGGVRLLRALGIRPAVYHMNEGHAAFLTLERVGQLAHKEGLTFDEARELVRATTLFTTHTPVPAGHDRFGEDLMRRHFSDVASWVGVPWERFYALGRVEGEGDEFNMTYLAMRFSSRTNGVSQLHGAASRKLLRNFWPGLLEGEVPVDAITNGVHLPTWTHPEIAQVLGSSDRAVRGEDFDRPLPAAERPRFWKAKRELKSRLIDLVRVRLQRGFLERGDSPLLLHRTLDGLKGDALVIGFARRFAPYKRAPLMFQDPERLQALLGDADRPVRVLIAGKAHPRDDHGRDLLRSIVERSREDGFVGKVIFLEDYDVELARRMVQGVDVWLNNPVRMLEASGTSGMKAAANGTLNLSVGDGWWPEAFDGENGWLIGEGRVYVDQTLQDQADASVLYRLLEEEVVPAYFERDAAGLPQRWLDRVVRSLETIPSVFDTDRMVSEYLERGYAPLALGCRELSSGTRERVRAVAARKHQLRKGFDELVIAAVQVAEMTDLRVGDPVSVRVEADLGPLAPEDVRVELVVGHPLSEGDLERRTATPLAHVGKTEDGQDAFEGVHEMTRSGSFSYGIRVRAPWEEPYGDSLRELVRWA